MVTAEGPHKYKHTILVVPKKTPSTPSDQVTQQILVFGWLLSTIIVRDL